MLGHRPLEVADYLQILKRRRLLIAVCAVVFPIIAAIATRFMSPKYLSQTLVLIEEQRVSGDIVQSVVASNLDSRLSSMKERILSRSRIQPIIERYNLYGNTSATMDDKVDMARKAIDIKPIHSAVTANTASLPGFFITFTAADAHTAQLVCGEITTLFTNENSSEREQASDETTNFLKTQLADSKRSLDEQDSKLKDFEVQYFGRLPNQEGTNMGMLNSLNAQLDASTQALAQLQQNKIYMDSMLAQQEGLRTPATAATPGPAAAPVGTQDQQKELRTLQNHEAELLAEYTPTHPDVLAVRRQMADLKKEIANSDTPSVAGGSSPRAAAQEPPVVQQLRAQLRALDSAITEKQREQAQIQGRLGNYQARIQSSPQVEEEYKSLTRDYSTAQKFYDDLNTKMNHSKMATDLERRQEGEQFKLMDEPNLPDSPSFPKLWIFALGGLGFGLAVGVAISAFLEYKDTALRTERDVWAFTRLPTLGIISMTGDIPVEQPATGFFQRFKRNPAPKPTSKPSKPSKPNKDSLAEARG